MMSDQTIVVRFNPLAGQWTASFEGSPEAALGGPTDAVAARRLLEGVGAGHGTYAVRCEVPASDPVTRLISDSVIWDPPELLVQCPTCRGRGEYVGLQKVEPCDACQGRRIVPV